METATVTNEQWKPIADFPGYAVSDQGRVMSLVYKGVLRNKLLTPGRNGRGYLQVDLRDRRGDRRSVTVHKLVAEAFFGTRPQGYDINHISGDKSDNAASNLEYCTRSQNMTHAAGTGLLKYAKITPTDVLEIRGLQGQGSAKQIAPRYGVGDRTIRDIWAGRRWGHIADEDDLLEATYEMGYDDAVDHLTRLSAYGTQPSAN